MKLIDRLTAEHFRADFWNSFEDWFIESDRIKIHRYRGSIVITDAANALKAGQVCEYVVLNWWPDDCTPYGLEKFFARHEFNLRAVFNALIALPWKRTPHHITGADTAYWDAIRLPALSALLPEMQLPADHHASASLELFRRENMAARVWSPWAKVNPLTEAPKKWTIPHVTRALLCGQFSGLKCNGVYTDDYAYDAAVNFQQGEIKHATAFARRILESPSGWWASGDNYGVVSICCHSFDSNQFKFELQAGRGAQSTTPSTLPTAPSAPPVSGQILVSVNRDRDGVEIRFPAKPSASVIDGLKARGWRWSRFNSCWYQRRKSESVTYAAKLAGLTDAQAAEIFSATAQSGPDHFDMMVEDQMAAACGL